MKLLLAPMEGLLDFVLRDVLTRVGGVDRCVSEFIRVSGGQWRDLDRANAAALARLQPEGIDLMLGRGSVSDPGLALAVRQALAQGAQDAPALPAELPPVVAWADLLPHIQRFWWMVCRDLTPNQRAGRLKQWLNLMRRRYPEAEVAFQCVRVITQQSLVTEWIEQECARCGVPFELHKQELATYEHRMPDGDYVLE
ncbi:hypothetical protein MA05_14725 [Comamonas aquatica]|uniref:hypothetical protein n=1 Tax=Comamonas aquatica TaxID=225991 RepID=UPI0005EC8142|nr:hypothetical protein [Comamonas aquatica]ANY63096.1 hypothetical protein MA05_14725 [Comamonas aquatica]